jgi:uncharacterized membrane protein YoaK (UPF0700 family)
MPIQHLRTLTGKERSQDGNRRLARYLAFVAGAANAGGFLAVQQYTSHMSGIVSGMADDLALGRFALLSAGLGALLSFLAGAACCAVLVHWGRRRRHHSEYALPLLLEAALLISFGLLGSQLEQHKWLFVPATVMLLCFIMGLQNAIMTKLSRAEIRTTHVTGLVTDIGIELGKLLYWNAPHDDQRIAVVRADRQKLALLASLVGLFFFGGASGALGFRYAGYVSTLPLAAILVMLCAVPVMDDVRAKLGHQAE